MNLHLKQTSRKLQLRDVALCIYIEGSKGIHNVKVWTTLEQNVLLMLYNLQTVQDVAEQSVE